MLIINELCLMITNFFIVVSLDFIGKDGLFRRIRRTMGSTKPPRFVYFDNFS